MGLSQLAITTQTIRPGCTLAEAARLMMADSVGALLITDEPKGVLEGIVTDRDLVQRIAEGADPAVETVASFVGRPVTTIHQGATRSEIANKLKAHGIRRLPVLDEAGELVGIVSLDDLLVDLGREMSDIAAAIRAEFRRETSDAQDFD